MLSRPESHGEQYARRFQDQSVVDRYHLRPTYPPETFTLLNALIRDEPRVVLDVGCGTGNIARPLAEYKENIHFKHRVQMDHIKFRAISDGILI